MEKLNIDSLWYCILTNVYHCFNQHSLYICANVLDNHVSFSVCLFVWPFLSPFFLLMDYNCQLIHIREWPEKKTEFEVEREVEWISVKCTLPTATLILGAYGKIDLDMEGWKELNFKKKNENVWSSNIHFARCLPKREIKKVIYIPWLWWLIT